MTAELHQPRVTLAHLPTPLEPLERIGIGGLWIKRDDCTGLAGGGNKTRKLEFLLGRALAEGAGGVVTFGALQSNHARQTAAACARLGLSCDLILTRAVDRPDDHYQRSGNLLLDRILGATIHVVDDPDAAFTLFAEIVKERKLFTIPPGGSDPTGTLAYVAAALELDEQLQARGIDRARIAVAASTCGTAAGLILGSVMCTTELAVDVACVYHPRDQTEDELRMLISATATEHGLTAPSDDAWTISDACLGEGYGIPTDACLRAIELVARTEGILLDPVYTGKAFALMLDEIGGRDVPTVFLHTGGAPGLSAYVPAFNGR